MNLVGIYKPGRRYLQKILFSVSILLVAFLIAVSASLYYNTGKTVLDIQKTANGKMLSQMAYHLETTNDMIKNVAISAYFDPDISLLMNSTITDQLQLYRSVMGLEKFFKSSPFIHSIVVYNAGNGCYYTYSEAAVTACEREQALDPIDQYLTSHEEPPKLKLVPISADSPEGGRSRIDFFSCFIYGPDMSGTGRRSVLTVNIRPDWLFDQLANMNRLAEEDERRLMLLDKSGDLYDPVEKKWSTDSETGKLVLANLNASAASSQLFVTGQGKQKMIISYVAAGPTGTDSWIVVSIQSYQLLFHKLLKMRTVSFAIIAVFIGLSLAGSAFLSFKLYRPVEMMLRYIREQNLGASDATGRRKDEFAFITDTIEQTAHQLDHLKQAQNEKDRIVKSYYLKRLVTDSGLLGPEEFREAVKQYGIRLNAARPFQLVLLQLERQEGNGTAQAVNSGLYLFAAGNIAGDLLSERFPCEIVETKDDHLAVLLNADGDEEAQAEVKQALLELQGFMLRYYRIPITAAVSGISHDLRSVSCLYEQAAELAKYKLVYGKGAILTRELIGPARAARQFEPDPELERRLAEAIRSGRPEAGKEWLREWFRQLAGLQADHMFYGMFHLISFLNRTIEEINLHNVRQMAFSPQSLYRQIAAVESLGEAEQLFEEWLGELVSKRKEPTGESTRRIVVETIKEIIEAKYMDPSIGLPQIADMVGLSGAHASQLFKRFESMTIPEYITETRLRHALELLKNPSYSVNRIMEMVGFGNQSHFFRTFKRKFGATPKEYRVKQILGQ